MSRRHIIKKYRVLDNSDTTLDPESIISEIAQVDIISYQIEIDATVISTLEVTYCNDELLTSSSVFYTLDFGQVLALDGSINTDGLIHIKNNGFKFLKLKVINNGGTGNISAFITGTGIGA